MKLKAGQNLGPYKIVAVLGTGGMGEVYRARDTRLERDVAIKVLPDTLGASPDAALRFEREARLLAQLNHANIATLYGFEQQDGQRFLVKVPVEDDSGRRIHVVTNWPSLLE